MTRKRSRTITLRGAAANDFMASASAFYCTSEEQARLMVEKAGDGPYGAALKKALHSYGWLKASPATLNEGKP